MLPTRKNVKNVKNLKGLPTKKMLPTGEMLKLLKNVKSFLGLAPPPFFWGGGSFEKNASHRRSVKNVKNLKGPLTKKCLKLGKC